MSLLIKALEQAAESKNAGEKVELSLEPLASNDAQVKATNEDLTKSQKVASTVFTAKKNAQPKPAANKLAWFALATLVLLLAAIGYFYWYWQSLAAPETVATRASIQHAEQSPSVENDTQASVSLDAEPSNPTMSDNTQDSTDKPKVESTKGENNTSTQPQTDSAKSIEPALTTIQQKKKLFSQTSEQNTTETAQHHSNSKPLVFGEPVPSNVDNGVKVTQNQPALSIHPKLIEAYNAYTKGEDAQAQQAYREVLKGDVQNTDALLGMATIAARQGRNDDAIGWYKKVLEIEPKNHVAQAGIVSLQQQDDPVSAETRLKNMLAQQPGSSSLYGSLGDLYAAQNQWPSAQQAYFQAFHYEPNNAQHVFNLAVSLDHMNKPNLALPYYKRALELATASGTASIDRAKLEARISQLSQ